MRKVIIDSNVLLVADNLHDDISSQCVINCVNFLEGITDSGTVVIDNSWIMLTEYQRKTKPSQPKHAGDVFLKWLHQNKGNATRVEQVAVTEKSPQIFNEFPDPDNQLDFDSDDRIFVAVANAHPEKPPIVQAADCKWLDWWRAFLEHDVEIDFICKDDVAEFYKRKFPHKELPEFPN